MTDFLKQNIDRRREEFELHATDFDLAWERIDRQLDGRDAVLPIYRQWRYVAGIAAILVALVTAGAFLLTGPDTAAEAPTLSMVSPEMAETEHYYALMISEKMDEIYANRQWVDAEVLQDLQLLDQAYGELRNDLADNLDNEEVINAMIINYKIKLEVLDRILKQVKEVKDGDENDQINL